MVVMVAIQTRKHWRERQEKCAGENSFLTSKRLHTDHPAILATGENFVGRTKVLVAYHVMTL